MKIAKSFRNILCALLIGAGAYQLSAETMGDKSFLLGDYTCLYNKEKSHRLEINKNNSSFSLKIIDLDLDNKADLIKLLENENNLTFAKRKFIFEDEIKRAQLFDTANQFLEYFSSENSNLLQTQKYSNYLKLAEQRFFEHKPVKQPINYNFYRFFSEKFEPKKDIESLIAYTYRRYSKLVRETKATNPEQTFQNLLENSSILDKLSFWSLAWNFANNMDDLGYRLEQDPSVDRNFLEMDFLNKNEKGKNMPYFKIEMNLDSSMDYSDFREIKKFLDDGNISVFRYDKKGKYLFGGFRCEK